MVINKHEQPKGGKEILKSQLKDLLILLFEREKFLRSKTNQICFLESVANRFRQKLEADKSSTVFFTDEEKKELKEIFKKQGELAKSRGLTFPEKESAPAEKPERVRPEREGGDQQISFFRRIVRDRLSVALIGFSVGFAVASGWWDHRLINPLNEKVKEEQSLRLKAEQKLQELGVKMEEFSRVEREETVEKQKYPSKLELSTKNFNEIVNGDRPVLIKVGDPSRCYPCRLLDAEVEKLKNIGVEMYIATVSLNTNKEGEQLVSLLEKIRGVGSISSIPVMIFKKGNKVEVTVGSRDLEELEELIKTYLGVDLKKN